MSAAPVIVDDAPRSSLPQTTGAAAAAAGAATASAGPAYLAPGLEVEKLKQKMAHEQQGARDDTIHVYVTGFGPFTHIPVNPSWQALKPMIGHSFTRKDGRKVQLHCREIEVAYDAVLAAVPRAHGLPATDGDTATTSEQHKRHPHRSYDLYVHVGVSPSRNHISIETRARRYGYGRQDFHNQLCRSAIDSKRGQLVHGFVEPDWDVDDDDGQLQPRYDVQALQRHIKDFGLADLKLSSDAGLFLCEYTFFCSLASAKRASQASGRPEKPVAFIHVPNENEPYSLLQLTEILYHIIDHLAQDLV